MKNDQRAELPVRSSNSMVEIHSIFYTIQGEGPYTGCPAIFVRFAGCNLRCDYCDTDYTSQRHEMTPKQVVATINGILDRETPGHTFPLIVFTGGEPFRQDFGEVVRELVDDGYDKLQVETNGTLFVEGFPYLAVDIVCSPKAQVIHDKLKQYVGHLKYVLRDDAICPDDGLPTQVLGRSLRPARPWSTFSGTTWLQPEDSGCLEKNESNRRAVVSSALKYGYRVSLQTHKLLEVQ